MKPKKSQKANLEKSRFIYFEIGIILALSFVLLAFEFAREEGNSLNEDLFSTQLYSETDIIISTRPKEENVKKIEIFTIINKVPNDDIIIDEPDFSFGEIDPDDFFDPDRFIQPVEKIEDTIEFIIVEEMPLFNGGNPDVEFTKYIKKHLRYPDRATENGVSGRVILTFVINNQGWIENLTVYNSAHPDLDQEAMSVVKSSPQWTPGKQRGKPVRVRYFFPVYFQIN